jgi:S-DNA-T family DNA segregation ATPase FtsK/SpoIIIE
VEERELLSITEENAILVTVQFVDAGFRTKTSRAEVESYDIELIVKNDIRCDQLIDAVQYGLEKKLNVYQVDLESLKSAHYSRDSRRPEGDAGEQPIERERSEKDVYILCWQIFQDCIHAYREEKVVYEQWDSDEWEKAVSPYRVAIGSINKREKEDRSADSTAHPDQIWLRKSIHGKKTLKELGFVSTTRLIFDSVGWHHSAALFQDRKVNRAFRETIPLYNISDRPLYAMDSTRIKIIPPTNPPQKSRQGMLFTLLTPLVMTGAMFVSRLFFSSGTSNAGMIAMSLAMVAATVITTSLNMSHQKKLYKAALREWKEHYELYIRRLIHSIREKQQWDVEQLKRLYPSKFGEDDVAGLVDLATAVSGDIFSRSSSHPRFLTIRLGLSTAESRLVPSVFHVEGEKKDVVFTSVRYKNIEGAADSPFTIVLPEQETLDSSLRYLTDLPYDIAQRYAYLQGAPVLLSLKECVSLGVLFPKPMSFRPFLDNVILELCFYHSPDELQCILFCEETENWRTRQHMVNLYKHLPHFRELLGNLSAFAFNKNQANLILNRLMELLTERKNAGEGAHFPHILLIFQEEYEFKRHPISEYLPDIPDQAEGTGRSIEGMSFIFCKRYSEELPKYCDQVIRAKSATEWYLLPHTRVIFRTPDGQESGAESQYRFTPDVPSPDPRDLDRREDLDHLYQAYKILSALYYYRIAQGADVPGYVELLHLYPSLLGETAGLKGRMWELLQQMWFPNNWEEARDVTKSLKVPIGKKYDDRDERSAKEENANVFLDLHESTDGPHMLVAGTTGSGKSETILTFLIGLAVRYSPSQVNMLLVDMKGGGFIKRIGGLPHVVGTISDVDGDENGAGASHMLKRFLLSMSAEVTRRKKLFNCLEVDSIDSYIRIRSSRKTLDEHIRNLSLDLEKPEDQHRIQRMEELLNPEFGLPHLFLVIDEFTELMRFSSENSNIDFKAEVNTLARVGRSLGFHIILISQNIQGAITDEIRHNSKSFLCLKVATREASKEMIGTDLAASPLMPGNGRAYLLVGTGSRFEYFQSGYSKADISSGLEQPICVTQAEIGGGYSSFYCSYDDNPITKKQIAKAKKGITQSQFFVEQIAQFAGERDEKAPHPVFQQPLPARCFFEFNWNKGSGICKLLNH